MDKPENYYNILGIPVYADSDTLKRAYRQLARRYHPDLAGPEGAIEMKRINRAYAVLSDPEKRQNYDLVIGGVIDLRQSAHSRPRPQPRRMEEEDLEFSGLNIFSTRGPLKAGPRIQSTLGVISSLNSVHSGQGLIIAAGSIDGKASTWQIINDKSQPVTNFALAPDSTIEAIRELRFSEAGTVLSGWNRLYLHVWDTLTGKLLWHYPLIGRAVSAPYSIDMALHIGTNGQRQVHMALPYLSEDTLAPSAWGVRGTDVASRDLNTQFGHISDPLVCIEEKLDNRHFWAIRMRTLSQDAQTLVTLSCALIPQEKQQMAIVRRWQLYTKSRLGKQSHPQISAAILVGACADCTPPYATTPDANTIAFVYKGNKVRLCDTQTGTYTEVQSGTMGGSSRLALSPDGQWLAVAREDSEINEGVVDLWSVATGQIVQKFYHPWQVSALHFSNLSSILQKQQLAVALTDGTIQVWR